MPVRAMPQRAGKGAPFCEDGGQGCAWLVTNPEDLLRALGLTLPSLASPNSDVGQRREVWKAMHTLTS